MGNREESAVLATNEDQSTKGGQERTQQIICCRSAGSRSRAEKTTTPGLNEIERRERFPQSMPEGRIEIRLGLGGKVGWASRPDEK
jgi:hypothetical protein